MAKPVCGLVPGADPFAELRLRKVSFGIQGMADRLHPVDVPRDYPAEAEQFLAFTDDHRTVDCRKGGDEMGDVENRLIEQGDRLVLAGDVFLPADYLIGGSLVAMDFCKGVHDAQHQGAKPLPRLFFAELVLYGNVAVWGEDLLAQLRREVDQRSAVAGIADHAD